MQGHTLTHAFTHAARTHLRLRSRCTLQVWVPDYAPPSVPGGVRMSEVELNRVASIAAAASTAPTQEEAPKEFVLPEWWNPGPRFVADPSVQVCPWRGCLQGALMWHMREHALQGALWQMGEHALQGALVWRTGKHALQGAHAPPRESGIH